MEFLEKDLEQIIFETDNQLLRDAGLEIGGNKIRQLRIGNYGIADLVTWTRYGEIMKITIYELKKGQLSTDALYQAVRYMKGIERYFKYRKSSFMVEVSIILVGSKIDTASSFIYLADYIYDLSVYTYHYKINGLTFKNNHGYALSNEGFTKK